MADDEKDFGEKEEDVDITESAAAFLGEEEDLPLSDEDDPLMGDFDEEEDDE